MNKKLNKDKGREEKSGVCSDDSGLDGEQVADVLVGGLLDEQEVVLLRLAHLADQAAGVARAAAAAAARVEDLGEVGVALELVVQVGREPPEVVQLGRLEPVGGRRGRIQLERLERLVTVVDGRRDGVVDDCKQYTKQLEYVDLVLHLEIYP